MSRLAAAGLTALAVLVLAAPAGASFPAARSRLVLITQNVFTAPTLVRDDGSLAPLGLPTGVHGSAAISPDGTQVAAVTTLSLFPQMKVPTLVVVAPDGTGVTRVTDNASEDLVQDWQPLKDVTAPVVHALPGKSRRGKAVRFRFTISESGAAAIDLSFGYSSGNGTTEIEGGTSIDHAVAGKVYALSLPPGAVRGAPRSFRFCITGTDASFNVGRKSCAAYRLLPTPKKRKR
jgi:hypothetical protein